MSYVFLIWRESLSWVVCEVLEHDHSSSTQQNTTFIH